MESESESTRRSMKCEYCGTPYVTKRKWNSGNPQDIELPECDCEAERTWARFEERLKKMQL
jgi:hypothetical protein